MRLEVRVQKRLGEFELAADFSVTADRCGVFGPSGSGKSTLLLLLAGLIRPDSGRIDLDGRRLFDSDRTIDLPPEKRRIGLLFQNCHLFPHLDVRRNLFYGWRRTPSAERCLAPESLLTTLELANLLDRGVANLSGGEQRRVALARTLLASPRLVLLDEPLTGLDQGLKEQIIPYLERVFREFGIPFLFVTHAADELQQLVEQVLVVERGRATGLMPVGALRQLQGTPGSYGNQ